MRYITIALGVSLAFACLKAETLTEGPDSKLVGQLNKRGFEILTEVDRIQNYRIVGWYSVNYRAVIFNTGASKSFLLTLRNSCDNLRSSNNLAFSSAATFITSKDHLVTHDPTGFVQRCLIKQIFELRRMTQDGHA